MSILCMPNNCSKGSFCYPCSQLLCCPTGSLKTSTQQLCAPTHKLFAVLMPMLMAPSRRLKRSAESGRPFWRVRASDSPRSMWRRGRSKRWGSTELPCLVCSKRHAATPQGPALCTPQGTLPLHKSLPCVFLWFTYTHLQSLPSQALLQMLRQFLVREAAQAHQGLTFTRVYKKVCRGKSSIRDVRDGKAAEDGFFGILLQQFPFISSSTKKALTCTSTSNSNDGKTWNLLWPWCAGGR